MTKKQQKMVGSTVVLLVFIVLSLYSSQAKPYTSSTPLPLASPSIATSVVTPATIPNTQVLSTTIATPSALVYQVTKVVDGDTIKVDLDGNIETVRIVGINTPETVDPRKTVECMGKEASDFTKTLLEGKLVRLEKDTTQSDRDRYGRLLRFVFLEDGTDVGKLLITEGYAQESLYSSKPHQYRQAYLEAQEQAQSQQKGLWNPAQCPPTTF